MFPKQKICNSCFNGLLYFLVAPFILLSTKTVDPILEIRSWGLSIWLFLSLTVILGLFKEQVRLPKYVLLSSLLFLIVACASFLNAYNLSEACVRLLHWVIGIGCFYSFVSFMHHDFSGFSYKVDSIITAIAGIYGICAVGELLILGFFQLPGGPAPHSLAGNRNILAAFLLISIPFSISFCRNSKSFSRYLGLLSIFVSLYLIVLIQSRAVWLAAIVLIILLPWALGISLSYVKVVYGKLKTCAVGTLFLISIIAGIIHSDKVDIYDSDIQSRFKSVAAFHHPSNAIRLSLWKKTIKMIAHYPFIGIGAGNWKLHLFNYQGVDSVTVIKNEIMPHAHNDLLQIGAETGLIGLCLFVGFIVFIIAAYLKKSCNSCHQSTFFRLKFLALILMIILCQFDCLLLRVETMVLFSLLLAYGINYTREPGMGNTGGVLCRLQLVILAILSLAGSIVFSVRCVAEKEMASPAISFDLKNCHGYAMETRRIAEFFYTLDPMANPVLYYRGTCQLLQGEIEAAANTLSHALQANPFHADALSNLGICRFHLKDTTAAIMLWERALEINHEHVSAAKNLEILIAAHGDINKTKLPANKDAINDPR